MTEKGRPMNGKNVLYWVGGLIILLIALPLLILPAIKAGIESVANDTPGAFSKEMEKAWGGFGSSGNGRVSRNNDYGRQMERPPNNPAYFGDPPDKWYWSPEERRRMGQQAYRGRQPQQGRTGVIRIPERTVTVRRPTVVFPAPQPHGNPCAGREGQRIQIRRGNRIDFFDCY